MKKTTVLVVVLIVVFSSPLFSETLDCQQSFDLGKTDAVAEYRFFRWYGAGVGFVFLGWLSALFLDFLAYESPYFGSAWSPTLPLAGAAVTLVFPFVQVVWSAERSYSNPVGALEVECYRDGYKKTMRRRNSGAVLLGELMAVAGLIAYHSIFDRPFLPPREEYPY
jgi:hypothetical protein